MDQVAGDAISVGVSDDSVISVFWFNRFQNVAQLVFRAMASVGFVRLLLSECCVRFAHNPNIRES